MEYLLFAASYLTGAIPFGLVVGKIAGVDVREHGSKNIGATNVSRTLGKKLGLVTLVLDVLKGFVPMAAAASLLAGSESKEVYVCLCGVLAVVGHMYPVYLGFKGGKGVATGLGAFLYISPLVILFSLFIFIGAVSLTGFVSAGSLLASGLFPFILWLLGGSTATISAAAAVAVLIWWKHRENIGRLLRGEEKSWKKKSDK